MTTITIDSKLKLITGLHIGGGDDTMKIGGVSSPVLKREVFCNKNGEVDFNLENRKITEPYIAGSSLKGKIRSLLEHYFGLIDFNEKNEKKLGKVVDSTTDFGDSKKIELIIKLFGESAGKNKKSNITRVIFRDCFITKEIREAYLDNRVELSEIKPENVIHRTKGTAEHPRFPERVPSGIEFDFDISIRVFDGDSPSLFENTIILGLNLLQLDALGGSGSRGYGKVEFEKYRQDKISDYIIQRDKLTKSIEEQLNETNKS